MAQLETTLNLSLNEGQQAALSTLLSSKLVLLTGGPGTGKTRLVAFLCHYLQQQGRSFVLMAPTGRAAKRLTEACAQPAHTLHAAFEIPLTEGPWSEAFAGDAYVLPARLADADVLIVDEASMMDLHMASYLCQALQAGCSLILVGDANQLPPIGAGPLFHALLDANVLPVACLHTVLRQAEGSLILQNAGRILRGEAPHMDQSLDSAFMGITAPDSMQLRQRFLRFYFEVLPKVYGVDPTQVLVLSPFRQGTLGVLELNQAIQARRQDGIAPFLSHKGQKFYVGDLVMQIRNHYGLEQRDWKASVTTRGVFNGECGRVVSLDLENQALEVAYEDGQVHYAYAQLPLLELAYVTTVHKAQGTERDWVILILPFAKGPLCSRALLYTGITRAKKRLFLFHLPSALNAFIQGQPPQEARRLLANRIQAAVKKLQRRAHA